jgi:hypothetical protein
MYKKIVAVTNDLSHYNYFFSWKAVIPLISIGYYITDKDGKIDYEKTEKLLEHIVFADREWMIDRRAKLPDRYKSKLKKLSVKELLDIYNENTIIMEKSDKITPVYESSFKIISDLRKGIYDKNVLPYKSTLTLTITDYNNLAYPVEWEVFDHLPVYVINIQAKHNQRATNRFFKNILMHILPPVSLYQQIKRYF